MPPRAGFGLLFGVTPLPPCPGAPHAFTNCLLMLRGLGHALGRPPLREVPGSRPRLSVNVITMPRMGLNRSCHMILHLRGIDKLRYQKYYRSPYIL